ncbi:hypothetical protein BDZ85DRAFT_283908 [Elsinoe ampelina]|uniref:Uncharacterized protein n=1 Tax=Elsinoe ampelina TaxID=302913 RepID=A0A6A6G620_9PEZI|nr:hypothetical protein BDZ85DRAFT_283908 [Elsinoe ampelina]
MAQPNNTQDARQLLFDFDVNPLRDPDPSRQRRQVIRLGRLTRPTAEQLAQTLAQNPASTPTIIRPNAAEAHLTADASETRGVIVGLWRRNPNEKQVGRGSVAVDRPDTWSDVVNDPHALRVICKMGGTDTGFYALLPPPTQAAPSLSDGFQVTSASVYFFPEFRDDALKNKTGDEGRVKVWLQNIKDFTGSQKKASRRSSTATAEEPPAKRRATPASVSARATPIVSNASAPATTQDTMPAFARFRLANPVSDTTYMAKYAAALNPSAVFPTVNQQPMTPQNAALHHLAPMGAPNFHHHPQPNTGAQPPLLLSQPLHSTPSIAPRLLNNPPHPIDTNPRPHTLPDLRNSDQTPTDIYDTYQAHIAMLDRQTTERRYMIEMLERHQAMDRLVIADLERTAARFRNNAVANSWHLVDRDYSGAVVAAYPLPNGADSRRREVAQATRDVRDAREARDARREHEGVNGMSGSSRGSGTEEGTEEGESEAS